MVVHGSTSALEQYPFRQLLIDLRHCIMYGSANVVDTIHSRSDLEFFDGTMLPGSWFEYNLVGILS